MYRPIFVKNKGTSFLGIRDLFQYLAVGIILLTFITIYKISFSRRIGSRGGIPFFCFIIFDLSALNPLVMKLRMELQAFLSGSH